MDSGWIHRGVAVEDVIDSLVLPQILAEIAKLAGIAPERVRAVHEIRASFAG